MLSFANNRSGQKLLCRSTFIPVMEAAELWNGDNLSNIQHLSRKRTLLAQAQVSSRFMAVAEVRRQRSLEVAGVQNDVVVEESLRIEPMSRSAYGFCQGLCGAVRISPMPSDLIRSRTSALYLLSRSRRR